MDVKNNIFVVSNNIERLEALIKYYNIYDKPTNTKLHVILDDRERSYNATTIAEHFQIHLASHMIEKTRQFFHEEYLFNILKIYGVAIKWLVFPYVHEVLGIKKAMMMDDDVFLLQPLDHYFENDYVFYNESALGVMGKFVEKVLEPKYRDLVDIAPMRYDPYFSMNSGQVIHTQNEHYIEFFNRAICKDVYILLLEGVDKYKKKRIHGGKNRTVEYGSEKNNRSIGGKYWIIEQNIYAIYYRWLVENNYDVKKFGADVRIWTTIMKDDQTVRKLPAYIHYLPTDKTPLYTTYAKRVEEILGEQNVSR